jgi:uncharacterized repeat protein (TIGR01451 family)
MAAHGMYGAATLTGPGGTLTPTPTGKPRAAFTDDSAQLSFYQNTSGSFSASTPAFASASARYEGQGNQALRPNDGTGVLAFVSTRDNPAGDLYLQGPDLAGGAPVRITCDGYNKTHPVVLVTADDTKALVAYASDAPGAGNDGHSNIWVATVSLPVDRSLLTAPSGCPALPPSSPLSGQSGENTWPAWTGPQSLSGSSNQVANELTYASTRENPLGDVYEQCAGGCVDTGGNPVAGMPSGASRRTFGPDGTVGNTEPTVVNDGELDDFAILVVTTTRFRPDGSLASTVLPAPDRPSPATTPVSSLWPANPPQSGQAAYADACTESGDVSCAPQPLVAYTSTGDDPYGDVLLAGVTMGSGSLQADGGTPTEVASRPGVAESDPAFALTAGYPPRLVGIYATVRGENAGISTAVAADGTGRQPFVAATTNEDYSQPAYSPGGRKVAYSALTTADSESPSSRVIVIANADGTGTPVQLETQPPGVATGETVEDSQPAWSPDGSKIAFTRVAPADGGTSTTVQWAAVPTGSNPSAPHQVTPVDTTDPELQVSDMDPSWAPDGTHLVLTRVVPGSDGGAGWLRSTALRDGNGTSYPNPVLFVVNATSGAGGPITTATVTGGLGGFSCPCPVAGRSPAWSPAGNKIAYDDSGLLQVLSLPAAIPATPPSDGVAASGWTTLVGFGGFTAGTGGTAAAARTTIQAAHDPAWSPDGAELYITGLPSTQPSNPGIYAMAANGGGLRTVAQLPQPETEPTAQAITGADLGVTIVPSRSPAYVGGRLTLTVTITNYGPATAPGGTLTFALPATLVPAAPSCLTAGSCPFGALPAGGKQVFTVSVTPRKQGTPPHGYTAVITATGSSSAPDPVPANNTGTLALPVRQPTLRLLPSVGPPGFVTLAYGEDFPPGALVQVVWQPGINAFDGPFPVAADGTLRVPLLIVRRDQLGTRLAVATNAQQLFSEVSAPMLVVPRSESPPRFLGRS